MSAEENKALVRRWFEEFCTGRKLDLAGELMAPDHIYHDPQVPSQPGPEGMAQVVAAYQNGVNGHWQIEEIEAAENDRVVVRWTGSGTHVGEINGIPPTGRSVRVDAISLLRVQNGKIAENWTVWDTLGFLQQLGVVPAAAPA